MNIESQASHDTSSPIVVLIRDLFFSIKVKNELERHGHDVVLVKREPELLSSVESLRPSLVLIDLSARPDWGALTPILDATDTPTLAFGPHKDVESRRAAQAAGVTRVITNQQLHRNLIEYVSRYIQT